MGPVTYDTAQAPAATTSQPARLVVTLPADATLTVNDQPTTQRTGRRVFTSPPLESGRTYYYTLKAQVVRDGQTMTTTRDVTVRAGRETDVNLDIPSATAAVRR
jgi:uncharacterized protein (TIGR03000 family)